MKNFLAVLVALTLACPVYAKNVKSGNTPKEKAKHVIVMISDGCGYNQIDAASMYQYGETGVQIYEEFPVKMGMSTYLIGGSYDPEAAWNSFAYVKDGATDSAAAATAMSTGVKTYASAIGVDAAQKNLKHAIEYAEERGMATGVVTSVEFSHATPAGFVAHNTSRSNYAEIANEMIYESPLEVIMGAGAPDCDNSGNSASTSNTTKYVGGDGTFEDLKDGRVTGADADGDGTDDEWTVIRSREDFQAMASGETPARVIGLPCVHTTLQQARGGGGSAAPYAVPLIDSVPSLEEMTKAALNVLDNDKDGFFLMVEGGAVDWAGHANQSGRVIEEEIDFNRSVEAVVAWVEENSNWRETLLIVTGDHETGYLNGPGSGPEADPHWMPLVNKGIEALPGMEWYSTGHTNSLVPFFANGSAARLFTLRIENTDPVRGPYIDNTTCARVVIDFLKK